MKLGPIKFSIWQSLLVYNACPQPLTEATVLVSPFLLQIDTFGKRRRCLTNVCDVKLKKRRYLDKCRLSASAEASDIWDGMGYTVGTGVATAQKIVQRPTTFLPGLHKSLGLLFEDLAGLAECFIF